MDSIQTPDGVFYIWDTQRDFTELVRRYISDDAANYIDAVILDVDKEQIMAQLRFESEYRRMESAL